MGTAQVKLVVLMRGLPGSGKSSVAKLLQQLVTGSIIVSADHYFTDTEHLLQAHWACRRAFSSALRAGAPLVVVDNTNTRLVEMRPYVDEARASGYETCVFELDCDLETSVARNVHQVPRETIEKFAARLRNPLPPDWSVVRI